tara:strand:- start:246 stop:809 length:564 start_codon:yes stop_codon:yes gene_type:complete
MSNTLRTTVDLPPFALEGIGQVIVHFSFLEWSVSELLYALMDVHPKIGRIAVASPRLDSRFDRIRDLIDLHRIDLGKADLKPLRKMISDLTNYRDGLAHGIWLIGDDGQPHLRVTSGKQPDTGRQKRIHPTAEPVDKDTFRHLTMAISEATETIQALHLRIEEQLSAWPDKRRLQYRSAYVREDPSE